jgi:hypothetical protein
MLYTYHNKAILVVVLLGLASIPITIITHVTMVRAELLGKDDIPDLPLNGSAVTLGEIDVFVKPYDGFLPGNGTLSISTAGANDIDINDPPPEGMTIVIDNHTATITSNPVSIAVPENANVVPPPTAAPTAAAAPTPADEGDGDDE